MKMTKGLPTADHDCEEMRNKDLLGEEGAAACVRRRVKDLLLLSPIGAGMARGRVESPGVNPMSQSV